MGQSAESLPSTSSTTEVGHIHTSQHKHENDRYVTTVVKRKGTYDQTTTKKREYFPVVVGRGGSRPLMQEMVGVTGATGHGEAVSMLNEEMDLLVDVGACRGTLAFTLAANAAETCIPPTLVTRYFKPWAWRGRGAPPPPRCWCPPPRRARRR